MTPQELADELARLAGWTKDAEGQWDFEPPRGTLYIGPFDHPFPVGSLDALEAFRREKLPDFRWSSVEWDKFGVHARGFLRLVRLISTTDHPDEWTARASALVAAAREESK